MTELNDRRFRDTQMLTTAELVNRGVDPDNPELLYVIDGQDVRLFPAFQFNGTSGLINVVRLMNEILEASKRPHEVTLWWISPNLSIYPAHKPPFSLLPRWIEEPSEGIAFAQEEMRRQLQG